MRINRAFVFPGQGAQYVSMGQEIYNNFAAARAVFDEVSDSLNYDIKKIIFNGPIELLSQTIHTQPALMCVSIAIVRVIEELTNVKIYKLGNFIAGHSLGEYSALCAAGSLTLSDTAKLLNVRARAMQDAVIAGDGGMAAIVNMPIEHLQALLIDIAKGDICQIANDNSTTQIVISGKLGIVEQVMIAVRDLGFKAIKLNVSAPFHSAYMSPATQAVAQKLADVNILSPNIRFIANVSAAELFEPEDIKESLVRQIESTVRWRETINFFAQQDLDEVIEIGAGQVLTNLIRKSNHKLIAHNIEFTKNIEEFLSRIN